MVSDLYLVAHKVRGEATFDIAERTMIGDEEAWIMPTSGWRVYPYLTTKLSPEAMAVLEEAPPDLPELFGSEPLARDKSPERVQSLLGILGLAPKVEQIKRRV